MEKSYGAKVKKNSSNLHIPLPYTCIMQEDLSPLDDAADDVVACTRDVYASLSWHDMKVATAPLH